MGGGGRGSEGFHNTYPTYHYDYYFTVAEFLFFVTYAAFSLPFFKAFVKTSCLGKVYTLAQPFRIVSGSLQLLPALRRETKPARNVS